MKMQQIKDRLKGLGMEDSTIYSITTIFKMLLMIRELKIIYGVFKDKEFDSTFIEADI